MTKSDGTPDLDETIGCVACDKPNSADNFVQCDNCDSWWHYSCAGVSGSVAQRDWVCSKCLPVSTKSEVAHSTTSSHRSRLQLELQRLAEEHELEKKQIALRAEQKYLRRKYQLLESTIGEDDDDRSLVSRKSGISTRDRVKQTNDWVDRHSDVKDPDNDDVEEEGAVGGTGNDKPESQQDAPTKHQRERDQPSNSKPVNSKDKDMQSSNQDQPQPTMQHIQDLQENLRLCLEQLNRQSKGPPETRPTGTKPKVPGKHPESRGSKDNPSGLNPPRRTVPVPEQLRPNPSSKPNSRPRGPEPVGEDLQEPPRPVPARPVQEPPRPVQEPPRPVPAYPVQEPPRPVQEPPRPVPAHPVQEPPRPVRDPRSPYLPILCDGGPTPQQLAARQILPRDLPVFSGNPADWPVFISNYNYTTEACGYSDGENMIRLQRCLKGAAWESVRSRLILPASVPNVIETLRLRYGRSDLLIESLVDKVKATPSPRVDKLDSIIEYGMVVQALCDHIVAAELLDHLSNPTLLKDLVYKLPAEYRMKWAAFRKQHGADNLQTFGIFMEDIVADACSVSSYSGVNDKTLRREKTKQSDRSFIHADTESRPSNASEQGQDRNAAEVVTSIECTVCRKVGHRAKECKEFQALTVDERWKRVQSQSLCRTCLFGHGRRSCRSSKRCGINGCQLRHHPLLHSNARTQTVQNAPSPTEQHHVHQQELPSLLFRIVPVVLHNGSKSISTFAFLDEGSSLTMLENSLANELGMTGYGKPLCLKWTGNVTREERNSRRVAFEISGLKKNRRYHVADVGTIESLDLPTQSFPVEAMKQHFPHLQGLPLEGYRDAKPQLLIGIDNLKLAVPLKTREGENGGPTAVKTRLGWSVYGGRKEDVQSYSYHICECGGDDSLNNAVKAYFALDEVGDKQADEISEEDKRAKRIMEETTQRIGERYETGLLWKHDKVEFPDSYGMAVKRLECLERRMAKDSTLRENIMRQIQEYQVKRYAHRASAEELANLDPRRTWFLPLGAVVNPKKPGKVRLIWDASAKVDGISLNTLLLKGPDELASLLNVLFRFRQFPVAVTADIKEMFHQLGIRELDKCAQLFLWRDDPSKQPEIYIMDVAVFGATCSPAMAQYVKNVNARRFIQDYPRAVEGIIQCHYVDDYLDSFLTVEEAKRVASEVKAIHKSGGFEIRGWGSNVAEIPIHLGEPTENVVKNLGLMKGEEAERVLGMRWLTEKDELKYSTEMRADITGLIKSGAVPTKRQVLRCLMTLFDPLGLAAPYVVHGKILLQDIWRSGSGWDEQIDESSFERWQDWTVMLRSIDKVRIPRSYFRNISAESLQDIQVHTFVDASPAAYACVSYLRIVNSDGEAEVALVAAKTKVAPLKPMTIPRLELQACVQGARLMKFVVDGHTFKISKRFLWTDSTVALSWINADPWKFRPFVAHRVSEIQECTQKMEWQLVPSEKNPADEASKWGVGPYFNSYSIWFSGPEFLRRPEDEWIDWEIPHHLVQPDKEELRSCCMHHEVFKPELIIDITRFSFWNRLHRSMAYVQRFIANSKRNANRQAGDLTQSELKKAEETLMRLVQWECFPEEMTTLTRNQQVADTEHRALEKTSKIYQLTPALDEAGVLRMDGRIAAASCASRDLKFPIILPKSHHLTHLIIDWQHRKLLHANNETVVNEVRQRFHVPNLRAQVRKVARNCQYCRIKKATPQIPRMAALPSARLSPYVRPFSYVGLDYFGPFLVKIGRSNAKRWVALFTCLTIRAVHVEVVHSLTTEGCIRSVRRFVCRRGAPLEIYSDNATNFQGAERVLREQINAGLTRTFTSTTTTWRFIPPGAPHMGGAWERMVRSMKAAITSAYNDERMDDESLHTLLVEAEALVNSRPLTYLPLDSEEQEALTPNHFLLGSSSGSKEESSVTTSDNAMLKQSWNVIQSRLDRFWSRWIREYLPVLTKRTKWFGETRNVQVDDLVLVLDETKKNRWIRGRVLEAITGQDGNVRQAVVQTSGGIFRRPVAKLAVLEVAGVDGTKDNTGSIGGRMLTPPADRQPGPGGRNEFSGDNT